MDSKKQKLLIVEDNESALFGYERSLRKAGYSIETATSLREAKKRVSSSFFNAILLDLKLPDGNALQWLPQLKKNYPSSPVIIITGTTDIPTAVSAIKYGAENFLTKPVEIIDLKETLRKSLEIYRLRRQERIQQRLAEKKEPCFGKSKSIKDLLKNAEIAASNDSVLLLQGETGTGKGVLARWIHEKSSRKSEAFVQLNCSSLKGELLRSELFGHVKGAFTSAIKDREGLIEVADGGTLFLDEIGDMDSAVQAQLLTAIEEKTFRRVGENKIRRSNFRLVCASNMDLLESTKNGGFRKDLYFRICVFPIYIPPLRERKEDIPELAKYFLKELGYAHFPLVKSVLNLLKQYAWPGNIRELRNMLERALLLAVGEPITLDHFPGFELFPSTQKEYDNKATLEEVEKMHIRKILTKCNNDKNKACEILGISLSSLYRRLNKR